MLNRVCLILAIACVLAMAPAPAEAGCGLDGIWYGNNSLGGDFVLTITKTGGGRHTAAGTNPEGTGQGEFVFKRAGEYETTWLAYIDNGDGTWLAFYMYGNVEMTSCDTWTAQTTWDLYVFEPGEFQDPFVDGIQLPSVEVELNYRRMP